MAAAAHDPEFAKNAGISTGAAKEWNQADKKSGTLKKSSTKPEHVKEESTMRGLIDLVQDAEIAKDIDDSQEQTDISLRSPSMYEDAEPQYDLQGKPVQPGQAAAPVNAGTSTERFGSAQWDSDHATPAVPEHPTQPTPTSPETPSEPLQEMPQRFDAFANQDRDEFVDKSAEMTGKQNMVPFAEHGQFDVMKIKNGSGFIAYDKQGKQLALLSGHISNNAVIGVKNVFVESAVAAKTDVKGVVYQMYMDIIEHGYSILSDGLHSDDAIKFWTRLMSNHTVYVVGDGEVLARANPEKVHKYWSDDEDSPSSELRLLLVK